MTEAVFAIPGDMFRRTGGFIYEATVLRCLNEIGCKTAHLQMPAGFPNPTPSELSEAVHALSAVPKGQVLLLDGFISGGIDPQALARIAARKVAVVHHPLGFEAGLPPSRAEFLLANERAALAHVDYVVVPSPHTAEILTAKFDVPSAAITIAEPGFNRNVLPRGPATPPLILSVGLLAERKGHDVLLAALSQLTDLNWTAHIVGKSHDATVAANLRVQCELLGLRDRVAFLGELEEPALAGQYRQATLFALATRYEGYGMVFGEAMLHGLPIVSCRTGAVPDTVREAGILCPVDDTTGFAQAMRQILESDELHARLSSNSQSQGERLPSWHDTAGTIAQVIRDLAPR